MLPAPCVVVKRGISQNLRCAAQERATDVIEPKLCFDFTGIICRRGEHPVTWLFYAQQIAKKYTMFLFLYDDFKLP
jgi:hypothetical protein